MKGKKETGVVRAGKRSDVALLTAIELAAGRLFPAGRIPQPDHTYPVADLVQAAEAGLLFIAEADGTVVGFATCSRRDARLHLDEVSVHPDYGRKGYGRALVERVLAVACETGQSGVSLTTFADIPWNGPFYASMGFLEVPESELDAALSEALDTERRLGMTERIAMIYPMDKEQRL